MKNSHKQMEKDFMRIYEGIEPAKQNLRYIRKKVKK